MMMLSKEEREEMRKASPEKWSSIYQLCDHADACDEQLAEYQEVAECLDELYVDAVGRIEELEAEFDKTLDDHGYMVKLAHAREKKLIEFVELYLAHGTSKEVTDTAKALLQSIKDGA